MRSVPRRELSKTAKNYLKRKSEQVASAHVDLQSSEVDRVWPSARRTKLFKSSILAVLYQMVDQHHRCMYCEDSRGTDVDHFWPKAHYPTKAFSWENMLLACTHCQRIKGDRFPLAVDGSASLIDPTSDDPWDFLVFVPETGRVTPRVDPATGLENARGETTCENLPLNDEPLNFGRQRTVRAFRRAITTYRERALHDFALVSQSTASREIIDAFSDHNCYGLIEWFTLRDGKDDALFREFDRDFPGISAAIRTLVQR